jgi:hypothetical protein
LERFPKSSERRIKVLERFPLSWKSLIKVSNSFQNISELLIKVLKEVPKSWKRRRDIRKSLLISGKRSLRPGSKRSRSPWSSCSDDPGGIFRELVVVLTDPYELRRKIGTGGDVGGWSDPAQIRVG